jgi:hypothetical protein
MTYLKNRCNPHEHSFLVNLVNIAIQKKKSDSTNPASQFQSVDIVEGGLCAWKPQERVKKTQKLFGSLLANPYAGNSHRDVGLFRDALKGVM